MTTTLDTKLGSQEWWRNDDVLSQRRCRACFKLDDQMLQNLNNYFCELCSHTDYIEPTLMEIRGNCEVPNLVTAGLGCIKRIKENCHRP